MGNRRYAKIRYPTTNIIERLHEIIISQRGFSGYGIEWASTNIEYALDKTPHSFTQRSRDDVRLYDIPCLL